MSFLLGRCSCASRIETRSKPPFNHLAELYMSEHPVDAHPTCSCVGLHSDAMSRFHIVKLHCFINGSPGDVKNCTCIYLTRYKTPISVR